MGVGRRLRVANIIEEGRLAGPQFRIVRVAQALDAQVDTTVVMPGKHSEDFQGLCERAGVKFEVMPLSGISKNWKSALRYLVFFPIEIYKLTRWFRQNAFDLVHVSGGSWQYKGVIAGWLTGTPVVWHLNDTSMPTIFRWLFSALHRLASGFIFASERSLDYYGALTPKAAPTFVVPAPANTDYFDPGSEYAGDEELIREWGDKLVIGTIGNVNPAKGHDVFIRAAAILNEDRSDLVFVVVGPVYKSQQKYFDERKKLCGTLGLKNIIFVGPRSDVRPLLKRFDIYVCCSMTESSPISVWEALSMAKPVVSTDVGDVPLYVHNGKNGFIVSVGDQYGLAAAQARLLDDQAMRQEFGRLARETATRDLDIERCARRHMQVYMGILGSQKNGSEAA